MISKKTYFRYLSYLIAALVFLPVFSNNLPPLIGSYHLYVSIFIFSILMFEPKVLTQKTVVYFLLFGLLFTVIFPILIWHNITKWNISAIRTEFYDMVIPIILLSYFKYSKDYEGLISFIRISVVFIIITGIMTFYSATIDPLYARMMMSWYSPAQMKFFYRLGGGTYGYVGSLLGIFPILIFYWRNSKGFIYSKRTIMALLIFLFFVVLTMQFFGNILIAILFIILSFTSAKNIKKTVWLLSILFVVSVSIPTANYVSVLKSSANLFSVDSENYGKLIDLALYIESGETSKSSAEGKTESRAARYPELLEVFLTNPLFGSASNSESTYNQAGAHLYWMNRLAVFGILGFSMMLLYHVYFLRTQIKAFNEAYVVYFLLACFAILSYGLIKSIGGRQVWFMYFVIIPGAYYLPLLNKTKNNAK